MKKALTSSQFLQIQLWNLCNKVRGAIYDVDDTLINSEVLQLLTWIAVTTQHCLREGRTATENVPEKQKLMEDFLKWVFKTGNFGVLVDGILLMLTVFKWRPEVTYAEFNEKNHPEISLISVHIYHELRMLGFPFPESLVADLPLEDRQAARLAYFAPPDPIDPSRREVCHRLAKARKSLEDYFAPIRVASMVATIRPEPTKWILPGVMEHLRATRALGIEFGFFTSTPEGVSYPVQNAIFGSRIFKEFFPEDRRLYGDQVERKPNPEGWFKMADRMGIDPSEIIIFDDRGNALKNALDSHSIRRYLPNELRAFGGAVCIIGHKDSEERIRAANEHLKDAPPGSYGFVNSLRGARWVNPSRAAR